MDPPVLFQIEAFFQGVNAYAMDKAEQNKKYFHEIRKLIEDEFYGKVVISMEKGRIVFLRKEQTIKL